MTAVKNAVPMLSLTARRRHRGAAGRPGHGFTLIELMVVVVIVGILAMIAYPSYNNQVRKNRRVDACGAMMQIHAAQEKYFTECNRYAANLFGTPRGCGAGQGAADSRLAFSNAFAAFGYYTFTATGGITNADNSVTPCNNDYSCGYTLTATPMGAQAGDGTMRINSRGDRLWDKNNNGSFDAGEGSLSCR